LLFAPFIPRLGHGCKVALELGLSLFLFQSCFTSLHLLFRVSQGGPSLPLRLAHRAPLFDKLFHIIDIDTNDFS
jgi:hypothetical protein